MIIRFQIELRTERSFLLRNKKGSKKDQKEITTQKVCDMIKFIQSEFTEEDQYGRDL